MNDYVITSVTLGGGKAVHAARDYKDGYMLSPNCGGNRACERYITTTREVTCKRCIAWVAKQTEKAERAAYYAGLAEKQDNFGSQAVETPAESAETVTESAETSKAKAEGKVCEICGTADIVYINSAGDTLCCPCAHCCNTGTPVETKIEAEAEAADALVLAGIETADTAELEAAREWLTAQLVRVDEKLAEKRAADRGPVRVYVDRIDDRTAIALMVGSHGFGNDPQMYIRYDREYSYPWGGCDDYDGRTIATRDATLHGCVKRWIRTRGLDPRAIQIVETDER